jgi:hypothetical protein
MRKLPASSLFSSHFIPIIISLFQLPLYRIYRYSNQGSSQDLSPLDGVQTGSGAHPASYPLAAGVKRPRREAYHSPLSSAEVKNTWILYLHSPICLHGVVLNWLSRGTTLHFTFYTLLPLLLLLLLVDLPLQCPDPVPGKEPFGL